MGSNPITKWTVDFLGEQKSRNSEYSQRDLGFTGKLGKHWYAVYGDTLWDKPFYMVRNSISRCTGNPLEVEDLNVRHDLPRQNQFIPWNPKWGEAQNWFIGVSSLLEVDPKEPIGAIFYLVTTGIMSADSKSLGAGIAMVKLVQGVPTVVKRFGEKGYWWPADTNPKWGDIAAFRDPRSEYMYTFAGAPTSLSADNDKRELVFLCRVKARDCFDQRKYEYWWGHSRGWSSRPLSQFDHETAVWKATGQGQVVWNEYLGCYIFVHLSMCRTSTHRFGCSANHLMSNQLHGALVTALFIFERRSIWKGHGHQTLVCSRTMPLTVALSMPESHTHTWMSPAER